MDLHHTPVLVREVVDFLRCGEGGIFVDCTVGDGGHAEAILRSAPSDARLIGLDRDERAVDAASRRLSSYGDRVTVLHANFRSLDSVLDRLRVTGVDGILFDLGMSSRQLEDPSRGFSFQKPGPLDMRMDTSRGETAQEFVNTLGEKELTRIFREYGEERWALRIARAIVRRRSSGPIRETMELVRAVEEAVPGRFRRGRIHPATRVFQALRIAVNDELAALREGLDGAVRSLRPGARLVAISFHSLEDRIVKQTLREKAGSGSLRLLTKRPIVAGGEEMARNPKCRSAKLRAAERTTEEGEAIGERVGPAGGP